MACRNSCNICRNLIISTAIAFTGGNLVVTIPAGSYDNGRKVCLVLAQAIPAATTVDAPVVIRIGTGPVLYPLQKCNGRPVTARSVSPRHRYSTRVLTTSDSGIFRLTGDICCQSSDNLTAINGEGTPATPTTGA